MPTTTATLSTSFHEDWNVAPVNRILTTFEAAEILNCYIGADDPGVEPANAAHVKVHPDPYVAGTYAIRYRDIDLLIAGWQYGMDQEVAADLVEEVTFTQWPPVSRIL